MKRMFSDQNGFTLVEVIISIAILSVASVVVLRLFVTSVDLNTQSRHSDIASVVATNTLEVLRQADSEEDLFDSFEGISPRGSAYELKLDLNEDFASPLLDFTGTSSDTGIAYYELSLVLTETDTTGLYDVTVQISELENGTVLAAYTTKHYLKMEVGLND